jgi:hypothetical protein
MTNLTTPLRLYAGLSLHGGALGYLPPTTHSRCETPLDPARPASIAGGQCNAYPSVVASGLVGPRSTGHIARLRFQTVLLRRMFSDSIRHCPNSLNVPRHLGCARSCIRGHSSERHDASPSDMCVGDGRTSPSRRGDVDELQLHMRHSRSLGFALPSSPVSLQHRTSQVS